MGVLDDMTKGITERKTAAAGPRLTPVGTEASPTKPSMTLPDDMGVFMSNERLTDHADSLRKFAAEAVIIAEGIEAMVRGEKPPDANRDRLEAEGGPEYARLLNIPGKLKEANAAKQAWLEAAGDAKAAAAKAQPKTTEEFTEHLATISAEAQASVFISADAPAAEPAAPTTAPADGWTCPDHGTDDLKQLTSRSKRLYMACQVAGCKLFEKGS